MTHAHVAAARVARRLTRPPVSSCRGVLGCSMSLSARPMRPSSVLCPVATASPTATPPVTTVPANANRRRPVAESPSRRSPSASAPPAFLTGRDSPVRTDSSTVRLRFWRRKMSAGTLSPSDRTTMSPWTSSRPGIRLWTPSLVTRARGLDISRRDSSALAVLRSWYSVIPMTRTTKPMSMAASAGSRPMTRYSAPLARSRMSIGSLMTSRMRRRMCFLPALGSSFQPCSRSLPAASALLSPGNLRMSMTSGTADTSPGSASHRRRAAAALSRCSEPRRLFARKIIRPGWTGQTA